MAGAIRLTVVGGGAIGLACAVAAQAAGAETTVVEASVCGAKTSRGNAGWVTPALSAPRAAPGAPVRVLQSTFRKNTGGPSVHPFADSLLATWLWRSWRSCTRSRHLAGAAAMMTLSRDAIEDFERLRAAGVNFEIHADGLLAVALREASIHRFLSELKELKALGYRGSVELLDGEAARALEPALSDQITAGLLLKDERHIRPESLCRGLVEQLQRLGGVVREHMPVTGFHQARSGEWVVSTAAGDLSSDRILVAAGIGSRSLLARSGVPLVMVGAGGTSVTASGSGSHPRRPLKLVETMVACSPFDEAVRLSGGYRIGLSNNRVRGCYVRRVLQGAVPYLRDWRPTEARVEWSGTRPITPDDLPIIGPVPGKPGLFVATGHGTLGITLAPTTARLLTDLIVRGLRRPVLTPFRVDRPAVAPPRVRVRRG